MEENNVLYKEESKKAGKMIERERQKERDRLQYKITYE